MLSLTAPSIDLRSFREAFGNRVQTNAPLARFTAARLGGPADVLVEVESVGELYRAASLAWEAGCPLTVLGGGSNVLVSDRGVRGVVILNRARLVRFDLKQDPPQVWAESGANFGGLARLAAGRGLAGLEWAVGIPGTLGGAVFGNAGAHSGDMAGNLLLADILHPGGMREAWPVEKMEYAYRTSILKRTPGTGLVLAATLRLERSTPNAVQARMDDYTARRKQTQPPGASLGSMFKNPPGDYAGRLIEAADLKAVRIGGAQISPVHANFFINTGNATAQDIVRLIHLAQDTVALRFGVDLELEIELLGEW